MFYQLSEVFIWLSLGIIIKSSYIDSRNKQSPKNGAWNKVYFRNEHSLTFGGRVTLYDWDNSKYLIPTNIKLTVTFAKSAGLLARIFLLLLKDPYDWLLTTLYVGKSDLCLPDLFGTYLSGV